MVQRCNGLILAVFAAGSLGLARDDEPRVNLELRPKTQTVFVGQAMDIGLYAVSGNEKTHSMSVINAVFVWGVDPLHIALMGNDERSGPYEWLVNGFPSGGFDNDGLNLTWDDGDAFLRAWSQFAPEPQAHATPEGLLVTTIQFEALMETPPGDPARFTFLPSWPGGTSVTRVVSGELGGFVITGTLGSATVTVVECGAVGDMDVDCDLDLTDYFDFGPCIQGPDSPFDAGCEGADVDGDGDVDLFDISIFQAAFTRP